MGRFHGDAQFDRYRILVLNENLILVNHLIFNVVGLAVLGAGRDVQALRVLVVGNGDGGVGLQGNLALIAVLGLGLLIIRSRFLSGSATRRRGALEAIVGFLQEGEVIVEGLHVEGAVDIQVTVRVDDIAQAAAIVALRATYPCIAAVIRGIGIHPVQNRQFVQRQLVAGCHLLLVVERCSEILDTRPHRVFPSRIAIGIEVFVHRGVGFFDLRMGSRLEVEVQILGKVPTEGEVTVPEELLVEGQGQALVLHILQIALLQFVVTARDLRVEGDALGQIVQSDGLGEVEPLRLALDFLEGLPGLIDR